MISASNPTLLVLSPIGIPPYSARGARQTLRPIPAARQQRRTVNGELRDLAPGQFAKYETAIQCNDMDSPAVDGVFPGLELTIDCISELAYLTGGTPQRPVVPGSSRTDGSFTFYRPRLLMLVTEWDFETDEWGSLVGWHLGAEEI